MKKLKPILFSTSMVESIMNGNKSQTRRICSYQFWSHSAKVDFNINGIHKKIDKDVTSRYQIDDILWIREPCDNWGTIIAPFIYKATELKYSDHSWKPSIHMPFDAARLFLKVTNVRLEKLQEISNEDAIAEGIEPLNMSSTQLIEQGQLYKNYFTKKRFQEGLPPFWSFNSLWTKINGCESWESNPYVFVYEFEVIPTVEGTCFLCGCTNDNCIRCIEKTGKPCSWANAARTICTACREEMKRKTNNPSNQFV
ncbi:hypothetical protein [Sphingobacterium hotanense]|uniref:hypothetical protein n=1 Tax=Sphingobacterium hotanense TaxID=649196 RepID=UPI0011F3F925|nr:hypothetical protein [Sphingobacterium hotanense]